MKRRFSLPIIAFASLLSTVGLAQEEFDGQKMASCRIDMAAHCAGTKPGGGRLVKCLQGKKTEITEGCRAAMVPTDFNGAEKGLTIAVTVDKLKAKQGVLIVMLYDDEDKFPGEPKRTIMMPFSGETAAVTFRHLKAGVYAVSVLHDFNDNSRFDLDAGDGFATSNDAVFPPTFAASAKKFDKDASVSVSMLYP